MSAPFLEDGYWKVSGVEGPSTASINTSLFDLDPILFTMLDFYVQLIDRHILPKWNQQVVAAGRPDLVNKSVAEALPYDINGNLQENQFRFPLLCIYPVQEEYEYVVTSFWHSTARFELLYIMNPISSEQMELLNPFLRYFAKVITNYTKQGIDTGLSQTIQWKDKVEKIGASRAVFGRIPGKPDSNIFFPALRMEIEVVEREMPALQNYEVFTGVDGYVIEATPNPPDGYNFEIDYIQDF